MYEYKFEKVKLKGKATGSQPQEDYHEIIHNYAKEGWRLVQIFAPSTYTMGTARYFEIIFERKTE